jgi:hypothetical protein
VADTASMVGVRRLAALQTVVGAVTRGVHIPQASAPHLMLTTRPRGELEPFGWNEHNIVTTGGTGSRSRQKGHRGNALSGWPTLAQPLPFPRGRSINDPRKVRRAVQSPSPHGQRRIVSKYSGELWLATQGF